MKIRITISFLILFSLYSEAKASHTINLRYFAELEIKGGKVIKGYFLSGTKEYPDSARTVFTDDSFTKFIKEQSDTLLFNIAIQHFKIGARTFETIAKKDIKKILTSTIKKARLTSYSEVSVYPQDGLVGPFSQKEISMLTGKTLFCHYLHKSSYNDVAWNFQMVSFNKDISEESLKQYSRTITMVAPTDDNSSEVALMAYYAKIKKELEKKNVICFWWFEGD